MTFLPPKIAFLDLEGTLLKKDLRFDDGKVAPSFWTVLAAKLGPKALAEENASKKKWDRDGYVGYVEWVEDSLRFLTRHGLTKSIFESSLANVETMDGLAELFAYFKAHKTKTCILTGGFKELTEKITSRFHVDHIVSACECQFKNNRLVGAISFPSDYFGKVDFMRIMMREHQLSPYDAIFIGDGKNDVSLARNVAVSISFNGQPELRAACTASIVQKSGRENLNAVVRLLKKPTKEMVNAIETAKPLKLKGRPKRISKDRCAQLWAEAMWARRAAYAPYSKFRVGSAILSANKQIFTGANFENAAFGSTICAERAAVGKMIVAGERKPIAIAITSDDQKPIPPCGECLQVLSEFAGDADILLGGSNGVVECYTLDALLPHRFSLHKG